MSTIEQGADDPYFSRFHAAAVRSEDFDNVYMVAMSFFATDIQEDPETGVWATNSLDAVGGPIMAVDGNAQELTHWPDSDTTDSAITQFDDGVDEAKSCLEDRPRWDPRP